MFLKPQLALTINSLDELPLPHDRYVMEPKFDGWRVLAHRWHGCGADGVEYYGRSGKLIDDTYLGHITQNLLKFPADTLLDGELWSYGGFGDVAAGLAGADGIQLRYTVFDVLQFKDHNARGVDLSIRRKLYYDIIHSQAPAVADAVYAVPQYDVSQEMYDEFIQQGIEGAMIKRKDSLYHCNKRRDWIKLKPRQTADMKVERIEERELGFLFYGEGRKCYSPRRKAREVKLGDVIEVQHDGITEDGNFRNPRLYRIRTDR